MNQPKSDIEGVPMRYVFYTLAFSTFVTAQVACWTLQGSTAERAVSSTLVLLGFTILSGAFYAEGDK